MRFEFYHPGLDAVPKLSVDGTVDNSVHFSHWQGNETPAEVKADTSTEIAINLASSPRFLELTQGIELVTNNHFDTDGVLSVWSVLNGARAIELRQQLIAAAEAGDFCEFTNEDAARISIAIQGSDSPIADEGGSPLANHLAGARIDDDARSYELVLPEVERLVTHIGEYEPLWRASWEKLAAGLESFEKGQSTVTEFPEAGLSLVTLSSQLFGPSGYDPTTYGVPFTAIAGYAKGQIYLIATPIDSAWSYRIDYPYYSWAETLVRPRVVRRDLSRMLKVLNELESQSNGTWRADTSELSSAAKFGAANGTASASSLQPDTVAAAIREHTVFTPSPSLAECMTS